MKFLFFYNQLHDK